MPSRWKKYNKKPSPNAFSTSGAVPGTKLNATRKRDRESMVGGTTFRQAIEDNKNRILVFLAENGEQYTTDICHNYSGEKELPAVRKALNELLKDGKIQTDNKVRMWRGKLWRLS